VHTQRRIHDLSADSVDTVPIEADSSSRFHGIKATGAGSAYTVP
jgi:hypothetical protein